MSQRTTLLQRRKARLAARYAWIDSEGDQHKAIHLFNESPEMKGIDPATLLLLLQIAIQLWQWWKDRQVKEPSITATADEPINLEDD